MKNRTNTLLRWLTIAVLLTLASTVVRAATTTIFSEDFESYTGPATSLTDTNDCDPVNPSYRVYDDNPVGFTNGAGVQLQNFLVHGGSQALLMRSGTELRLSLLNPKSGPRYTFDFWLNVRKAPTGSHSFYLILKGAGADINSDDYVAYRSDRATNSATIWYYDGVANNNAGYWSNTLALHIEDTWQHHRLVIDTATQKMNIFLDDMVNPVASNVDISRCEVPVPTVLRIIHEGNSADDGYYAIDDITLTVDDSRDLATTFTDGFESYAPRVLAEDDADPQGPWITVETDGTGTGRTLAPAKVQVVDASVVPAHSGNRCLKLEAGQRAGASIAWGVPPQSDVQITWWARVPASVDGTVGNYLRMSLYGAENGFTFQNNTACDTVGDNALLGYGSRDATIGDDTSLTCFVTAWLDSTIDYTPDTWEQYRLITHTSQGRYTIVKDPLSANPHVIADRYPFIGGTITNGSPVFMAAWSSSNGTNHPPVYVDDIEIKSLVSNPDPLGEPYTVSLIGNRFTNYTKITTGGTIGTVAVDPRDNTTILFTQDSAPGGIYRATKVAAGNWAVDPVPVVSGLDRPSGLAVAADGTLWWTHDYTMSLSRLKSPWASNTPENVVTNFGTAVTDDDPIDVTIAPANFTGVIGKPGMIVVADRGSDGDANNAINLVEPASPADQTNETFLVSPTSGTLGDNLNAIAALPSGEVATLSTDGFISAVNGDGVVRYILPATLWVNPPRSGAGIAADPTTGRVWVTDDLLDEVWSIAADTGADQKEIAFPLVDPLRPERQIDFHDPGMAFAPNGSFMVLTDTSTTSGGGYMYIFHNEALAVPNFGITQHGRVNATTFQLSWASAGGVKYRVQRSTDLGNPAGFTDISADLTGTSFTDTNAPAGAAYYRVIAKP